MANKPRTSLNDLLTFLNRSSIEPNLAWTIPHLYNKKKEYEIQWIFNLVAEENFYIREKGESAWLNMTSEDLIDYMNIEKLDLIYFEFQLLKVVCIQAVCSHCYIERAGELIGKDKIEEAIKLITSFTEEKENQEDKESSEDQDKKGSSVPRLKLVRRKKKKDNDEE